MKERLIQNQVNKEYLRRSIGPTGEKHISSHLRSVEGIDRWLILEYILRKFNKKAHVFTIWIFCYCSQFFWSSNVCFFLEWLNTLFPWIVCPYVHYHVNTLFFQSLCDWMLTPFRITKHFFPWNPLNEKFKNKSLLHYQRMV